VLEPSGYQAIFFRHWLPRGGWLPPSLDLVFGLKYRIVQYRDWFSIFWWVRWCI